MADIGETPQRQLASEAGEAARSLAGSIRTVRTPSDSSAIIDEVRATVDALKQVTAQLSWWHSGVVEGREHAGENSSGSGTAVEDAAAQLLSASRFLSAAGDAIAGAREANSTIRWIDPGDA